ncbi:PEGA domain-containing protein [Pendulispora albinea]|uniref:PEGA domain-containing protein n=1 Tax=Pendulispora albinea TaxID=2741071 RepID=A0ABZ2M6U9_9BACT
MTRAARRLDPTGPLALASTLSFAAFFGALATTPRPAYAQPSATERATAQELFDQGRTAMQAGNYREACPKFEQSQRLDPGGGTLLNLAVCHEKEGRSATAWAEFHDALSVARRDGRKDREKLATDRIQALAPSLPRLAVHVVSPVTPVPEGIEVRIDGAPLPRAAWDVATPLDPGTHAITTGRDGFASWSRTITLRPGETQRIDAELRPPAVAPVVILDPAPPASPAGASPPALAAPTYGPVGPPEPPPSPFPPLTETKRHGRRSTAFYVVGGVGIASLVTSAVTGILALSARSKSEETCIAERHFCANAHGLDDATRARTLAVVSTATLFTGITGVGIALFLPLRYDEAKTSARIQFAPLAQGGGQFTIHKPF